MWEISAEAVRSWCCSDGGTVPSCLSDRVGVLSRLAVQSLRKQHKEVGSFRFPNKSKFNTFSEHTKVRRSAGTVHSLYA